MYNNIKSCIFVNGQSSNFFPCERGLRQGENLSPVLFSLFLNGLQNSLVFLGANGIDLQIGTPQQWLKLLIILYADDTLIVSDDEKDFQKALNSFSEYCKTWKLNVNLNKSNVF